MSVEEYELPELAEAPRLRPGDAGYNVFEDEESPFYGLSPSWKPTKDRPIPTVRCARTKSNGERCKRRAIRGSGLETGQGFCRSHGGALPHVKAYSEAVVEAAKMRLIESTPMALDKLVGLLEDNQTADNVKLAAIKEVLDRAGVKAGYELSVEVTQGESPSDKLMKKLNSMRTEEVTLEDLGEVHEEPKKETTDAEESQKGFTD